MAEKPMLKSPDDPESKNIAAQLGDKERKKIAQMVVLDYDQDVKDRKPWEEKRDRYYKLWMCQRDKKTTPWVDASNVCLPMLATACNQFHGRAYQAFFSPPQFVRTIPVGMNDIERARNVEKFMDWQIRYDIEDYEEETDKLLLNTAIGGTNFKKIYFDSKNQRPVAEYVSGTNLVLPYRTRNLKTARRKAHRLWLHYDELKERNRRKLYVDFEKIPEVASAESQQETPAEETKDKTEFKTSSDTQKPHLIIECHRSYQTSKDKEPVPYILTVHRDTQTLLRAIRSQVTVGGKSVDLDYFVDYHFIPNPEGYYSFGFGHFLEVLNEMANTAFNQIFDAGRLSNQPFGFYGRRAGIKRREIKLHPGHMTEVEDASQVFFPQMQRLDQALFQVLGIIQQFGEQFTSVSDFMTGRFPKGMRAPVTGGTLAVLEQGLIQFSIMTKRLFRSLEKEMRLLFLNNQLFLPQTKQYVVMESEENIAFPEIHRAELDSVRHVVPMGDPSYASRIQRRQEAQELYSFLINNPLVGLSPQGVQLQNPEALWQVTHDLIESYDNKKVGRYLPKPPDPPISPDAENALFMQGGTSAPKPGEDHSLHLQVHEAFRQTDFYKEMPPEYKKKHEDHLVATKAMAMLEARLKASLGNPGPQNIMSGLQNLVPEQNGNGAEPEEAPAEEEAPLNGQ